jgi:hypothetical protein
MVMPLMKQRITAILISLMLPSAVCAQSSIDRRGSRIATADGGGPLHRSALREAERIVKIVANQSQQHRRVRHPVLLGAAIGAGAGFLINATACRTGESICTGGGNVLMAGIGGGIGAAVGALVSH